MVQVLQDRRPIFFFLIVTATWPTSLQNSKMARNRPEKTWILDLSSNLPLLCFEFHLEYYLNMHLKSIWSWECLLKAADGFSRRAHDQWVWIVLKSRENKSVQAMEISIYPSHKSFGRKKRHMKKRTCLPSTSKFDWVIESPTQSIPSLYSAISNLRLCWCLRQT